MGGRSFNHPDKEELALAVVSSFFEDSYYEGKNDRLTRIKELVKKIAVKSPLFVAKLAIITRKEFHMRSSFHILVGELSRNHRGDSIVKNTIKLGAERVDDLLEIAAYLERPLPNQIKKGIREAVAKFNAHKLAKYRGENKEFSLVDIFNLVHPKPDSKSENAYKKLITNELKNTATWEARLSKGESKGEVFKEMLEDDELGYMATLRNLRNIVQSGDTKAIKLAAKLIADKEEVKKSKQLPFRFLSAFEAIGVSQSRGRKIVFEKDVDGVELLKEALEKALKASVANIPKLYGKTMILTDNSGSMRGDYGGSSALSAYSSRTTANIANLFAVLYWLRADNTFVGVFGDNLEQPKLDREKGVFENYDKIDRVGATIGGGTEHGIFEAMRNLIETKEIVDRIVIFSDSQIGERCQWYGTDRFDSENGGNFNKLFNEYKKINPDVKVYSIDLKGYGNKIAPGGIYLLGGWSDKIFELMSLVEKEQGLVKWIEDYPVELEN
jgi:hypothetical protein